MGNSPIRTPARVREFYSDSAWIEGRAVDQLHDVAGWAGMRAVAAFPDLHPGRFGPVGGAFLADRIYPQLIGPDIGCGMALFRLDLPRRKLKLDKAARRLQALDESADPETGAASLDGTGAARFGPYGLGTLGGGNHFCEVQVVDALTDPAVASRLGMDVGDLCLLVHSGSRGHGAAVFTGIADTWADGFAPGSAAAEAYVTLHDAAQVWARVNRALIAAQASEALRCDARLICDAPHNHLEQRADGWLHRKGAAAPDRGLAPLAGSRESLSYLMAVPEGPPEALGSVSHGAGRRYDRAAMHGRIRRVKSELEAMRQTRFGGRVICADRDLLIEEAGNAYKDAGAVLRDLEAFGLAQEVAAFAPLITFKTGKGARG
ncbi:RNA ligase RtcB family protein [Antarctobacter heliothermus]|uniref:3'-phosphate/5'-hydroxy nucleic acid ligase n=1 Tax=Antarctobacter heliothermus TaxID=74033 RepID=A0A239E8Q5_9RHOB|nr:RNA ligase RtcB family protein [Antarctobacter heliothermus]SNS40403.1 release factor H-coupled RctB family protein [Antarctobacter heliothermus]